MTTTIMVHKRVEIFFAIVGLPKGICDMIARYTGVENDMPLLVKALEHPWDCFDYNYALIKVFSVNLPLLSHSELR